MAFDRVSSPVPPRVANPETRLVAEYLALKFPQYIVAQKQPLGPAIDDAPVPSARPWQMEIDAWVLMADPAAVVWYYAPRVSDRRPSTIFVVERAPADAVLLLIEGKVTALVDGLAKLDLYRDLVTSTPTLRGLWDREVRARLVAPRMSEQARIIAAKRGIELDAFEPDWIREYWQWRDRYWTGEYRRERQARIEARKRMGL